LAERKAAARLDRKMEEFGLTSRAENQNENFLAYAYILKAKSRY
jgi:hypothetical protein